MFGKREKQVDKVNLPIEKTPAQSNSANPDYNHSIEEFLIQTFIKNTIVHFVTPSQKAELS